MLCTKYDEDKYPATEDMLTDLNRVLSRLRPPQAHSPNIPDNERRLERRVTPDRQPAAVALYQTKAHRRTATVPRISHMHVTPRDREHLVLDPECKVGQRRAARKRIPSRGPIVLCARHSSPVVLYDASRQQHQARTRVGHAADVLHLEWALSYPVAAGRPAPETSVAEHGRVGDVALVLGRVDVSKVARAFYSKSACLLL